MKNAYALVFTDGMMAAVAAGHRTGLLSEAKVRAAIERLGSRRKLYQPAGANPLDAEHIADRLINGVIAIDEGGCWIWGRSRSWFGYGGLTIARRCRHAHRVSLAIHLGVQPGDLDEACHSCDNPPCINPEHLFDGSHGDNVRDAISKGRAVPPIVRFVGSKNPHAKLTEESARSIKARLALGEQGALIATDFGVSKSTVSLIKLGRIWSHA